MGLPVPLSQDECPDCGADVVTAMRDEPALFFHGGYGASRRTISRHCGERCGWYMTAETSEVRPAR